MTFPLWHIALTSLIAALVSLGILRLRFPAAIPWRDAIAMSVVVGASVLVWRLAGNVGALNDDPIPPVSPNDVLAPVMTYVALGMYEALRGPSGRTVPSAGVWLAAVSFVVNVVVI